MDLEMSDVDGPSSFIARVLWLLKLHITLRRLQGFSYAASGVNLNHSHRD